MLGGRSTFVELLAHDADPRFDGATAGFTRRRFRRSGAEDSRVRGRFGCATFLRMVAPASPRSDGSLRRLRPNPIGSDTSCRATRVDYDGSTVIELPDAPASHSNEFESSPPGTPLARGLPERAASRTPSRKGDAFRRTRGAFRRKTPLAGSALVHSLYPTCGGEDPRLFYLRALPRTDGASGASGTRPLFEQRIPTIRRGLTTRTR